MSEYGIGKYEVTVTEAYLGKSKTKGTPQLEIVFDGELGTISAFRYFTEGGWQYFEKELIALGWDPAANGYDFDLLHTEKDENGAIVKESALKGARCQIVTKQESYRDAETGEEKVSLKVQFINSLGRKREELPDEERTPFLKALKKSAIQWSGKPPSKPAAQAPKPAADRTERTKQAAKEGAARAGSRSQRLQGVTGGAPPETVPEEEPPPSDEDWGDEGRF